MTIMGQPICQNDVIRLDFDAHLSEDSLIRLKIEGKAGAFGELFARFLSKLNAKKFNF